MILKFIIYNQKHLSYYCHLGREADLVSTL